MGGGDYIYAISEKAVTAHNVATMEKTGLQSYLQIINQFTNHIITMKK